MHAVLGSATNVVLRSSFMMSVVRVFVPICRGARGGVLLAWLR